MFTENSAASSGPVLSGDEVLHDEAAVRRECPVCAAGDVPVLRLGEHVADRVQHDDVVAGAKVVLEHVSRAQADLG